MLYIKKKKTFYCNYILIFYHTDTNYMNVLYKSLFMDLYLFEQKFFVFYEKTFVSPPRKKKSIFNGLDLHDHVCMSDVYIYFILCIERAKEDVMKKICVRCLFECVYLWMYKCKCLYNLKK